MVRQARGRDNGTKAEALVEAAGAKVLRLPPYNNVAVLNPADAGNVQCKSVILQSRPACSFRDEARLRVDPRQRLGDQP